MLYEKIYISSATRLFGQDELVELMRACRRNNHANGVTGLLLYHEGSFIQVLEGPQNAVEATFHRIEQDPRHQGVIELLHGEIPARRFPQWSMGFKTSLDLTDEDRAAFADLLEAPQLFPPDRAGVLLSSFRAVNA